MASLTCSDVVTSGGCSQTYYESDINTLAADMQKHIESNHPAWLAQQNPQMVQFLPFMMQKLMKNAYSFI